MPEFPVAELLRTRYRRVIPRPQAAQPAPMSRPAPILRTAPPPDSGSSNRGVTCGGTLTSTSLMPPSAPVISRR